MSLNSDSSLAGKVALVTGASGGIGSATARLLAQHGCAVAIHFFSNLVGAQELGKDLGLLGVPFKLFREDLLKPGAPQGLIQRVLKRFGRLDIVVNNAGAVIGQEPFTDLEEKDWDKTLRLHATVPFILSREAFKAMKRAGGRIINISSVAAKFGGSERSMHYGAAKAALEAITVGMARHGASRNILVNAIRPGVIDTPLHDKFRKDMKARVSLIPLKRMGRPEDVARTVFFLAGPGGDYITGQVLPVTGGE